MALKRKITKTAFDKLSDELKKEYKKGEGDDEMVLDVDGDEDTGALKRARDREKQRADDEKARADKAEDDLTTFKASRTRAEKDVDSLTRSYDKKLLDQKTESDATNAKLSGKIKTAALESTAMQIAQAITKSPKLLMPVIKARLQVDLNDDGDPVIKILDAKGAVSAAKPEDLQKEIAADKEFASIITASKASGSGANSRPFSENAGGGNQSDKPVSLAALTPKDLAANLMAKKAESQA